MKYHTKKDNYRIVLYGKNDVNRNADGSSTASSIKKTNQTQTLTPYITTYENTSNNCKTLRFNLGNNFTNKQLSENSHLFLNSFILPILNDGDKQYFTNLKLLGVGDACKDYNNLNNEEVILATSYNTANLSYQYTFTTGVSIHYTPISEQIITYNGENYYLINRDKIYNIATTNTILTITENQLLRCPIYPDIVIKDEYNNDLTNNITKIYGYDDYYFQLTSNNMGTAILTSAPMNCDILLVGSGGYGGSNYTINGNDYYGGGGGAGEIVFLEDYTLPTGLHTLHKFLNSNVLFEIESGEILEAEAGGRGGDLSNLPTSGGSGGGGGYMTQSSTNLITTTITPVDVVGNSDFIYFSFTAPNNTTTTYSFTTTTNFTADILIVGGGGSGGIRVGGGGGAGAVIHLQNQSLNAGTYTISVGKGGDAITTNLSSAPSGINGDDSSIILSGNTIYRAKGGGGGGGGGTNNSGLTGGSSGGTVWTGSSPNVLTTNVPVGTYGNKGGGGTYNANDYAGGGGGGAGGIGGNASSASSSGNGGAGVQISITGTPTFYGAGGGAGIGSVTTTTLTAGTGGSSIGGNGSIRNATASNGVNGTGSGGGGSGFNNSGNGVSGAGGSGIVIIRVPKNSYSYQNGAPAGLIYTHDFVNSEGSNITIDGDANAGSNAFNFKAGDGGSATDRIYNMMGSNITYGIGGYGASNGFIASTKPSYLGYGGDGNGGVGGDGTVIIRFKNLGTILQTIDTVSTSNAPYSISYNHDMIINNKHNPYKVPSNFLNKNYIDLQVETLSSGGSNISFSATELDRLVVDMSIIEVDKEISNDVNNIY